MATTDAVSAICNTIVHILRTAMAEQIDDLNLTGVNPTFEVYTASDFTDANSARHITSGASVFLYRALPNLSHRAPPGRLLPNGRRHFNQFALDLHLLITLWGNNPTTQNRLVGWVVRTLEDFPVIPAAVLNIGSGTPIFNDDEAVELIFSEMGSEELLQLWDMLGNGDLYYQVSLPYLVRQVNVESRRSSDPADAVQIRTLDMRRYDGVTP